MRNIIFILFLCVVPLVSFGQAQQSIDTNLDCKSLYGLAYNRMKQERWQESYDAHVQYIDKCALDLDSYYVFGNMEVVNQMRSAENGRYPEHLQWLKKVLYYNPDTGYYCADVRSMIQTFMYFYSVHRTYIEGGIAVSKYLIDSAHCDNIDEALLKEMNANIAYMYKRWRDTVTDSLKTPFKLVIPSLEELDLAILRGPKSNVTPASHNPHLGELIATRNPFTDILELKYRLSKSGMVRIDVFDLLGRSVYAEGQGYKHDGEHVLSLQAKGWSPGSYYVRLSTPSGEIKTVKLVKQ